MATETRASLADYADRTAADDAHAAHHASLARQAEEALSGRTHIPQADRAALADRLERWRYQWLAQRAGRLAAEDCGLVDALDLAANRLLGKPPRLPRRPRRAIQPKGGMASLASPCSDVAGWLDPAAPLDELIALAAATTATHFGLHGDATTDAAARLTHRRILLYAPLYLSSFCINPCAYCGFRFDQPIQRRHLGIDEAVAEAEILRTRGFRHILLVAGDFPRLARTEYFAEIVGRLRAMGISTAVEIAPQSTQSYAELTAAGVSGVTLYQETYQEDHYRGYHPGGTKASFDWRLEGLERAAEAGVRRLGLGVLLGLADPRDDLLAMLRHAAYLRGRFPDCGLAFSLPRIHVAPSDFHLVHQVDDETLVRLYCTLRLAVPDANLVLSTREQPELRARLARICITQLSAGSCTSPGGYGHEPADGQFPVNDHRGVDEVAGWLRGEGFQPVWDCEDLEGG